MLASDGAEGEALTNYDGTDGRTPQDMTPTRLPKSITPRVKKGIDEARQHVNKEFALLIAAPAIVSDLPHLRFGELEAGDVVIQNTCGPPAILGS